jgi:hypothetical protein
MTTFYAYVEIAEYGEPVRQKRIGPFHPEDPDARVEDQAETLRSNLAAHGETVMRIEVAT